MPPAKKTIDPRWRFWTGMAVATCLLIVLIVYLFTDVAMAQKEWVLLYVLIALTAAIAASIWLPDSTGEVSNTELGFKMTGGAAIGICFILVTHWLTKDRPDQIPPQRILSVPLSADLLAQKNLQVKAYDTDALGAVVLLNQHLLVEFKNDRHHTGWVEIYHPVKGDKARADKYLVQREKDQGKMSPYQESK